MHRGCENVVWRAIWMEIPDLAGKAASKLQGTLTAFGSKRRLQDRCWVATYRRIQKPPEDPGKDLARQNFEIWARGSAVISFRIRLLQPLCSSHPPLEYNYVFGARR